jgi:4-alpha-glucanotransferase
MLDTRVTSRRGSGVLLHPSSLPGPGIGDLGEAADLFIDWLANAGQGFWQILPLVEVDAGGSPYNGLSALAGNTLLISPERLREEGLLDAAGVAKGEQLPRDQVDYPAILQVRDEQLKQAYRRFREGAAPHLAEPFELFREANHEWLADYALFKALRDHHGQAAWVEWPADIRAREAESVEKWRSLLADEIERQSFQQFLFDRQWHRLRQRAHARGIRIIGDLPIFVAYDSADVWSNPELFELDSSGAPIVVSGVPPDYFSETGQLWGNPLYRWDVMRARGYEWWVGRFRRTLDMVDVIRIDHFRGFESFWEIPAGASTAVHGHWVEGPGADFFHAVEKRLGKLPLIAEDLGLITSQVERLRDEMGFPGMRVLQFAFDGDGGNTHLPANYSAASVAYTGTHDNDTLRGWWARLGGDERERVRSWAGKRDLDSWDFVEAIFASAAGVAIVPLQDLLALGSEARMNTPGRAKNNWTWRLADRWPDEALAHRLYELTVQSHRLTRD